MLLFTCHACVNSRTLVFCLLKEKLFFSPTCYDYRKDFGLWLHAAFLWIVLQIWYTQRQCIQQAVAWSCGSAHMYSYNTRFKHVSESRVMCRGRPGSLPFRFFFSSEGDVKRCRSENTMEVQEVWMLKVLSTTERQRSHTPWLPTHSSQSER